MQGHTFACDWWCVGILAYECFVGTTPFTSDDPMETYRKILKCEIDWPDELQSYRTLAHDLTDRLITVDAARRLGGGAVVGARGGAREVRDHPWFADHINWSALEKKAMQPPFVPELADSLDVGQFDEYDEDEALAEYPDTYEDRETFADWSDQWV